MNQYIKCHKCGQVFETVGYYGKSPGRRCGTQTGVDLRFGNAGWIYCRAILKKSAVFEAASFKEAKQQH